MRLRRNKVNKANNIYFDPIKITSPEQFVPLYLAQQTDDDFLWPSDNSHESCLPFGTDVPEGGYSLEDTDYALDKERIKNKLISILNHSYPNEYRLDIPFDYGYRLAEEHPGVWLNSFDGSRLYNYKDGIIRLGLLVTGISWERYTHIKVSALYDDYQSLMLKASEITPELLIVVKAKHIPYIKARLYLRLPLNLPLQDMIILILSTSKSEVYKYIVQSDVYSNLSKQIPMTKYMEADEIMSYLIPPFNNNDKSTEQYLKDVLASMEEEVLV